VIDSIIYVLTVLAAFLLGLVIGLVAMQRAYGDVVRKTEARYDAAYARQEAEHAATVKRMMDEVVRLN
jgi:hypothetical protein